MNINFTFWGFVVVLVVGCLIVSLVEAVFDFIQRIKSKPQPEPQPAGVVLYGRAVESDSTIYLYDQPEGKFLGCFGPAAASNIPGLSDLKPEDGCRAVRIEVLP